MNGIRPGETDMNDIDIEEGRRLADVASDGPWNHRQYPLGFISSDKANIAQTYDGGTMAGEQHANGDLIVWLRNNAAAMFDAIETGRQWKTIARRLADAVEALLEPDDGQPEGMDLHGNLVYAHPEWEAKNALAAFRDHADRISGETLRERAVREVDAEHGYTMEFSSSPEAHAAEYDERERDLADRTPTPTDGA